MPGKAPVLIIDDEVLVQNLLGMLLEGDGFEVISALSGTKGLELAREAEPEAIILDVGLPDIDGFEVCRRLREFTDAVILFATAKDNREDILRGLQLGADDYVVKPYSYEELVARLNACLRRQTAGKRPTLVRSAYGEGLLLDPSQRVVFIEDGQSVQLTPKEFELLRFMVENRGQVLSVDEILTEVWGPAYVGERDLVKQFIYRLRSKLEPDPSNPQSIVTIRGSGYTLEEVTKPSGASERAEKAAGVDTLPYSAGAGSTPTRPGFRRSDIQRALEGSSGGKSRTSSQQEVAKDGLRRWVWQTWAGRAASVGVAVVFMLAVTPIASADALPGGILYPVKTISEDMRLAFAGTDLRGIQLHLEFAGRRLDETVSLLAQNRSAGVPAIMAEYENEVLEASWIMANTTRGGHPEVEVMESLMKSVTDSHNRVLADLVRTSPDDARPAIAHAAAVLNREAEAVRALFAGEETQTPMAGARGEDAEVGSPAEAIETGLATGVLLAEGGTGTPMSSESSRATDQGLGEATWSPGNSAPPDAQTATKVVLTPTSDPQSTTPPLATPSEARDASPSPYGSATPPPGPRP